MSVNLSSDNLIISENNETVKKVKKTILEEDEFVGRLEKIIERDYFPDIAKLKPKVSQLSNNNSSRSFLSMDQADKDLSINEFLNKYTSEDNASFFKLMESTKQRYQEKNPWFFVNEKKIKQEIENSLQIKLPDNNKDIVSCNNKNLITWPYKNKNSVMFNPDGESLTSQEIVDLESKNKQQIIVENTRFRKAPYRKITYRLNTNQSSSSVNTEASLNTNKNYVYSKYDSSGEVINSSKKNYELVESTPLIKPEENSEDFGFFWGEIDSTPINLDSGFSTPSAGKFRLQELSAREEVALKLNDQFSKSKNKSSDLRKWTNSSISHKTHNSPRTPKLSSSFNNLARNQLKLKKSVVLSKNKSFSPNNRSTYSHSNIKSLIRLKKNYSEPKENFD